MRSTTILLVSLAAFSFLPVLHAQQAQPGPAPDLAQEQNPCFDGLSFLAFEDGHNYAHSMDVEISGDRAYLLVGWSSGLETYDISDPTNPVFLNRQGPAVWGAKAYGDRLYAFSRQNGFRIYDISGSTPAFLGEYNPAPFEELYENGVLHGDTLYVAAHQNGVIAFDVSTPSNPALLDTIDLADNDCWDVEFFGGYLFVANGHFGITVVEPLPSAIEVATLPMPGLTNHIVLDGSVAFLSLGGDGVATVDLSTPTSPQVMDTAPSKGNAFGSGVANHMAVVGSWSMLELFDISDPADIRLAGWDDTQTWAMGADIKASGNSEIVAVADWYGMSTHRTVIDSNPDIDFYPQHLDFGHVTGSETEVIKVHNYGAQTLNVDIGNIPPGFTVEPASFSVAPGFSRSVRITAGNSGTVNSYLLYNSNDPDEPVVRQFVYKNNSAFPQVGDAAPIFSLPDIRGTWHTLSDYQGKVVYLEFGGLW